MWSEEFDKKLRAAQDAPADNGFRESDWQNMQRLLDIHLPQKKKRRRIFFWIILLMIGISMPVLLVVRKSSESTASTQNNKKDDNASENPTAFSDQLPRKSIPQHSTPVLSDRPADSKSPGSNSTVAATVGTLPGGNNLQPPDNIFPKKSVRQFAASKKNKERKTTATPTIGRETSSRLLSPQLADTAAIVADKPVDQPTPFASAPAVVKAQSVRPTTDSLKADTAAIITKKEKSGDKNVLRKFSITLSAGPDLSSIGFSKTGKIRTLVGAGLSYDINNRLTIRSGVYASRKVYGADSADYHPPTSFWNYYTNLQHVDANCLVIEIPVTLVYKFNNWFVSAGISSFIMKKEDYGYSYKDAGGQPSYYTHHYRNENSHTFSVANLSGGYTRHFNKRVSLSAEPYLKLPLNGIGFGKIKLNSSGILFTVAVKPF